MSLVRVCGTRLHCRPRPRNWQIFSGLSGSPTRAPAVRSEPLVQAVQALRSAEYSLGDERVEAFFVPDRGGWAVSRVNDGVGREGEHFLTDAPEQQRAVAVGKVRA